MEMNGYNLLRNWFDYAFENPHKVKPAHSALYAYILDSWNRYGQKQNFGLPALHTMEAIGIRSKTTYYKAYNDLIEFGFIKVIEAAQNQNTSNIISLTAISKNTSAPASALDSANVQHLRRHVDTRGNIDKQVNNKQGNKQIYRSFDHLSLSVDEFNRLKEEYTEVSINDTMDKIENYYNNKKFKSLYLTLRSWLKKSGEKTDVTDCGLRIGDKKEGKGEVKFILNGKPVWSGNKSKPSKNFTK